jgi:hypothetical protein
LLFDTDGARTTTRGDIGPQNGCVHRVGAGFAHDAVGPHFNNHFVGEHSGPGHFHDGRTRLTCADLVNGNNGCTPAERDDNT